MRRKLGKVYLIGAGPGDPELITVKGQKLLKKAEVVIFDRLVNAQILEAAPQAEKIYAGKRARPALNSGNSRKKRIEEQRPINRLLVQYARKGKTVVRLKGGDPFVFARGGEEAEHLAKHHIPFEIVPGITAGIAVPAFAGIPVTDRRVASLVTFVTAHQEEFKKTNLNWTYLARLNGTLILFMGVKTLSGAVQKLLQNGRRAEEWVCVVEWGSLPYQRTVEGTLKTIVSRVRKEKIQSPALVIIGDVGRLRSKLKWFEKRPLFGKRVVMTRAQSQKSCLREKLNNLGAETIEFPAIEILPPKNTKPLDRALKTIHRYDWIFLTSVNGVASVMERIRKIGKDSRLFSRTKIAAIGEATFDLLSRHGLKADLMPKQFTSEVLLRTFKKEHTIAGKRFLLPRTDIAPKFLKEALTAEGGLVDEVIAYRTVIPKSESRRLKTTFQKRGVDFVLFTSASTVNNFFKILPAVLKRRPSFKSISIGPVTSQALRKAGIRSVREARKHTLDGLIEVLLHAAKK